MEEKYTNDIAIIGMAGRFPRSGNIDLFFQNLTKGVNSVSQSDEDKMLASGLSKPILNDRRFVNASSKLEDAKYFDADFFKLSNSEATLMDPQIRLLLQTSWHALEDAGYATNQSGVSVGNFCGMSSNTYLIEILKTNSRTETINPLLYRILNEKDFLATWISYKLNLTGPSMSVQTACSTSLLAVHLACQSLLNRECDMALAGGVSYDSGDGIGYVHVPESIFSSDGVCRPFDKDASGTVGGDGLGTIVLKRAYDAIRDKDHIYALIKGTAANNDGTNKQGYTTPSVDFQRDVVLEALAVSNINPETIGMIEAHGTGTLIGDPIEVSALTEAFREYTKKKQYCAIGSVKSNIGHLDAAAGIASIIKTVLCVNKGVLVPNINYSEPNPSLNLSSSPFYVSTDYIPWPNNFDIRRAGVSSLGVGGTNVHVIIEQAPTFERCEPVKLPSVIALSGLNQNSLQKQKKRLAEYITKNPDLRLEDIEFTSIYGRKVMPFRFTAISSNLSDLAMQLNGNQDNLCYEGSGDLTQSVFLFPGQGSQYTNMAVDLYEQNEAFRNDMDYCFNYVKSLYRVDFKELIFSTDNEVLDKTENAQISLFILEYCLAKELFRSGIKPDALIGHSLGEYVAACIAGCISLEESLKLVFQRGRLMGKMPNGKMVLVRIKKEDLSPMLLDSISICAYNTENSLVVGGKKEDIEKQIKLFDANNIRYIKLKVSHAYHTPMMQNALKEFEKVLSEVEFNQFDVKIFSTNAGGLVGPELFCSHQYWLDQIINPVRFQDAVERAIDYLSNPVFVEVGPGNGLSSFVKTITDQQASTVSLLPSQANSDSSPKDFSKVKAFLCAKGLVFDLPLSHPGKRISLPGYVFLKNYFWKPKTIINYTDFNEIAQSYHQNSENYLSSGMRSSIEVQFSKDSEISTDLLDKLNNLQTKYLNDIEQIFSSETEKIHHVVDMLYDECHVHVEEDFLLNPKEFNKKREVNSIFVKPTTDTEQKIASHWGSILGYQPVSIVDDYFEVGGNSLLATQLINQISNEMEIQLTISDVLITHTVKNLAQLVDEKITLKLENEQSNELII